MELPQYETEPRLYRIRLVLKNICFFAPSPPTPSLNSFLIKSVLQANSWRGTGAYEGQVVTSSRINWFNYRWNWRCVLIVELLTWRCFFWAFTLIDLRRRKATKSTGRISTRVDMDTERETETNVNNDHRTILSLHCGVGGWPKGQLFISLKFQLFVLSMPAGAVHPVVASTWARHE